MTIGNPDLIITAIILISTIIGLVRGFIKESISLVTWIVACFLTLALGPVVAQHLTFTQYSVIKDLAGFLIVFVSTIFVGAVINFIVANLLGNTIFNGPDRVLGALFGLGRGIVLSVLLILIGGLTKFPQTTWWQHSYLIAELEPMAHWLLVRLPDDIKHGFGSVKQALISEDETPHVEKVDEAIKKPPILHPAKPVN